MLTYSSACPDLICLMKVSADQYRLLFIVGTIKYTFLSIIKTVLGGTSVVRDDNRLVPRAPYSASSFPLTSGREPAVLEISELESGDKHVPQSRRWYFTSAYFH